MVIVYGDIPDKFFSNMVILDMLIFSDIRNYGNVTYGTIFLISYCLSCSSI